MISILISRWNFEDKFLMRPTFPNLPNPQSECLLSRFWPRLTHTQDRYQEIRSCQIGEDLIDLALKSDDIHPLLQKEFRSYRVILNQWTKRNDWSFEWFSKSSFARSFPFCQEVLDISQIAIVNITFSLNWSRPYQGGCSQVLISSKGFNSFICDWKNKLSFFFGKYHLFRIVSFFWVDFRCVHRLQLLKICNQHVTLPNSPRVQCVSKEKSR